VTARASSGVSESIHPAWAQKKIEEEELSSRRSVTSSSGTSETKSRTSGRGNLRGNDARRDREVDDEDEVAAVARRSRCCGVIWTSAQAALLLDRSTHPPRPLPRLIPKIKTKINARVWYVYNEVKAKNWAKFIRAHSRALSDGTGGISTAQAFHRR